MSPGSPSPTMNRARRILSPVALTAAFYMSPEELAEKARQQARDSEGKFVEEADVKAELTGEVETVGSTPTEASEPATPPPPAVSTPPTVPAEPVPLADYGFDPAREQQLRTFMKGQSLTLKEDQRTELAALRVDAYGLIGERLGWTEEETNAAIEVEDDMMDAWTRAGPLAQSGAPSEMYERIYAASEALRTGKTPETVDERALTLMRTYAQTTLAERGAKTVPLLRLVTFRQGAYVLSAPEGSNIEADAFPLSSWAIERGLPSIQGWLGRSSATPALLRTTADASQVWAAFHGDERLRNNQVKAKGEYIIDSGAGFTTENGLTVEALPVPESEVPFVPRLLDVPARLRERFPDLTGAEFGFSQDPFVRNAKSGKHPDAVGEYDEEVLAAFIEVSPLLAQLSEDGDYAAIVQAVRTADVDPRTMSSFLALAYSHYSNSQWVIDQYDVERNEHIRRRARRMLDADPTMVTRLVAALRGEEATPPPPPEAEWRAAYDAARAELPADMADFGKVPRTPETLAPKYQAALLKYRSAIDAFRAGNMTPEQVRIIRSNGPLNLEYRERDEQLAMLEASFEEFTERTKRYSDADLGDATMVPDVVLDAEGNEVPGPTAQRHLDALLATGKVLGDELERRIAARRVEEIETLPDDLLARAAEWRRELDSTTDLLELKQLALEQEERLVRDRALDDAWRDMVLAPYSEHARRRPFQSIEEVAAVASGAKRTTPGRRAAAKELQERMARVERDSRELAGLRRELEQGRRRVARQQARLRQLQEGNAVPGTDAYARFQREESIALLAELRGMGGTAQVSTARVPDAKQDQARDSMQMAFDSFPTDWLRDIEAMGIEVSLSGRGMFRRANERRPAQIELSPDERAPAARPYRATATHEFGHAVAEARPHISAAEWVMSHRRSPRTDEQMILMMETQEGAERGYSDQWAGTYTGKVYHDRPTEQWEVFTTGLESLLTNSEYFDRLMEQHGYDAEFRAFILALMAEA